MSLHHSTQPSGARKPHSQPDAELTFIARETADDHGVVVSIGERGGGSYAAIQEKKLTLDPAHLDDRQKAKFVSAHEGGHIADTASPQDLGLHEWKLQELGKSIGFSPLDNVIEDGAVNDRICRDFPTLADYALATYTKSEGELGCISHPEIDSMIQVLGFVPSYGRAIAAILSDWSEVRHAYGFNISAEQRRSLPYAGPPPKDPDIERFLLRSLPAARAAIASIYQNGALPEQRREASLLRFEIIDKVLYPELKTLVVSDLKKLAQAIQKSEEQAQQQQLSEQQGDSPSQSNQQSIETQNDVGSNSGDQVRQESNSNPSPESLRQAKELLAKFDDALREATGSAFGKRDQIPSVSEVITRANQQEREQEKQDREAQKFRDFKGSTDKLIESIQSSMPPYQQYYRRMAGAIDEIYNELIYTFMPEQQFHWRKGHSSGSQVDMVRAMQFTATGEGFGKLFMRRTRPREPDVSLALLIDRSGSMRGPRSHAAVSAAVFATELFDRLNIECTSIAFAHKPEILIHFDDDIRDNHVQESLMQALNTGGGTKDADAFEMALREIEQCPRKGIIILSDAETSQDQQLRDVVQKARNKAIPIIHFGLGKGTKDQKGIYDKSFGELEIDSQTPNDPNDFLTIFTREMKRLAEEFFS